MSIANNRINAKLIKVKGFIFTILAILVFTSLANTPNVQATVPVASGFQIYTQGKGVKVYRKLNPNGATYDYVTVLDLRYGFLSSFTGWVYGDPYASATVERRSLKTHWTNAVAQNTSSRTAKVALNGTFFDTVHYPSAIAFGLKANWWKMSYGYGIGKEYPGKELTLAFDPWYGSSSIQPYKLDMFNWGIPDLVGGLDNSANKDGRRNEKIPRTYVGVRDDNGDGNSETVIFFSSSSSTQDGAVQILSGFGAGSKMMLDGGGSTGLIVDGDEKIKTTRTLPQVFIIWSGKY